MMNRNRIRKTTRFLFKTFLILSLLSSILIIIEALSYPNISPKTDENKFRIGYINLNRSQVSKDDLLKMQSFACDLWLFAEWNGDNLQKLPDFISQYEILYEKRDSFTYGNAVLIRPKFASSVQLSHISGKKYSCPYEQIYLQKDRMKLAFLHAPPPVPTCAYQTEAYITNALNHLHQNQETQQIQLIIGDFNTLPSHASYQRILQAGYQDVFASSLFYMGTFAPFPQLPKLLRIDYCFATNNDQAEGLGRFKIANSDHNGLLVELE